MSGWWKAKTSSWGSYADATRAGFRAIQAQQRMALLEEVEGEGAEGGGGEAAQGQDQPQRSPAEVQAERETREALRKLREAQEQEEAMPLVLNAVWRVNVIDIQQSVRPACELLFSRVASATDASEARMSASGAEAGVSAAELETARRQRRAAGTELLRSRAEGLRVLGRIFVREGAASIERAILYARKLAAEEAPARKRVEDEMERLSAAMHSAGISSGSRPPAPPSSAAAESKKAGGKAERDRLYAVAQLQTAFLKQQNPVSDDEDEEDDRTM